MSPEQQGIRPLVVVDSSGTIVDVTTTNRKGFTKSTEQGELWFLHQETGRVLPYSERFSLVSLSDEDRWYRAVVEERSSGRDTTPSGGTASVEAPAEKVFDSGSRVSAAEAGRILGDLCEVIQSRRNERPEGSYTTYLFNAGEEKIRKKTGEEAIELVLARNRREVVSESADLIYHLLVLLNQLEIPLGEVLGELAGRA